MANNNQQNIHEGHRKRLLELVTNVGIERVSDVQALEFILTYVIPRTDTNPLAHRLLDRFGTLANVLDASWEALIFVEGMGETSAKKLSNFKPIFNLYQLSCLDGRLHLEYKSDIVKFFEGILRNRSDENLYIVGLNASNYVKMWHRLSIGNRKTVDTHLRDVAKFVAVCKPSYVMLGHNHNDNLATPTENDEHATSIIADLVESLGSPLVDHIIVGDDGVYSMFNKEYFRIYTRN